MIKPFAKSVDDKEMSIHLYAAPLLVVEETENEILIMHKGDHIYAFWFDKKNIERSI